MEMYLFLAKVIGGYQFQSKTSSIKEINRPLKFFSLFHIDSYRVSDPFLYFDGVELSLKFSKIVCLN